MLMGRGTSGGVRLDRVWLALGHERCGDPLRQLRPELADKLSRDCRRLASDWY
jgi:hypothetical protein